MDFAVSKLDHAGYVSGCRLRLNYALAAGLAAASVALLCFSTKSSGSRGAIKEAADKGEGGYLHSRVVPGVCCRLTLQQNCTSGCAHMLRCPCGCWDLVPLQVPRGGELHGCHPAHRARHHRGGERRVKDTGRSGQGS